MSTSFSWPQVNKLVATLIQRGVTPDLLQDRLLGDGIMADVAQALVAGKIPARSEFRKVLGLKPLDDGQVTVVTPVTTNQDLIRIDRSIRLTYPDFVKEGYTDTPEFIRLEATGPSNYSLGSLQLSLHPKQEHGVATGHEVWEYQKQLGLEGCLGLSDLLAIQSLGIAAFRHHWKGKAVFGWKSVVQDDDGVLFVPYLVERGGQVKLNWHWLDFDWSADNPALRFAK